MMKKAPLTNPVTSFSHAAADIWSYASVSRNASDSPVTEGQQQCVMTHESDFSLSHTRTHTSACTDCARTATHSHCPPGTQSTPRIHCNYLCSPGNLVMWLLGKVWISVQCILLDLQSHERTKQMGRWSSQMNTDVYVLALRCVRDLITGTADKLWLCLCIW